MGLINILLGLHILIGQYITISTARFTSIVLRLCSICVCLIVNSLMCYYMYVTYTDKRNVTICILLTLEYSFWCVFSYISRQDYITSFSRATLSCDSVMGYEKSAIENKFILTVFITNVVIHFTSFFCDLIISEYWSNWVYTDGFPAFAVLVSQSFTLEASDLAIIRLSIVIGTLQNRLMKLRCSLEENTIPDIVNENEIELKVDIVRKCVLNYKHLLDAFDDVSTHLNLIMIVTFTFTSPEFVFLVYTFIKEIIFDRALWRIVYVDLTRLFLRIATPCIICELCYNEVDRLKMLLVKQITQSEDIVLREELERAMDYMTRRPFRFSVLRTFRIDVKLPVTFLAVTVTYTVLLIEFSHFVL